MRKIFILFLPLLLIVGCSNNSHEEKNEVQEQHSINSNQNVTSENTDDNKAIAKDRNNEADKDGNDESQENGDLQDTHTNDEKDKREQTKKIQCTDMLDEVAEELEPLEEKAQNGTQTEMDEAQDDLYERWDVALNEVYDNLKKELSDKDMKALRKEQRKWVENRDEYAKEEAAELKGGSLYSYTLTEAKKEFTKERCYELVEDYME